MVLDGPRNLPMRSLWFVILFVLLPSEGVETKKQLAFPGYELERYQLSAVGNSKYAAKLEAVISYVEETGVYNKMEAADVYGDKTSKNWWLNLVSNEEVAVPKGSLLG